jgi:succinate-acetate transporter protein
MTDDGSLAPYARITLRPIGSPLPLGLLALMCAGVLLSLEQIGALALDQGRPIALILIGFVVPLELLAAILSFLARDTVAGTGLSLFTGAWLATALVSLSSQPGATSPALGSFLFALSAAMVVLIAGASFGKAGPAVVIVFGAARFLVTGLYEVTGSTGLERAAAVLGFGLAAAALYSALATVVEDVQGEMKLPMGRRAKARDALEAPFSAQLDRLEHEAGVRQQL